VAIKISNSTIIDDSRNIVNAGITSVTSVSIGNTEVISSARQLKNIASLDATTTAAIGSAVASAPNTFTTLNVTGISTFTNGPVLVGTATSNASGAKLQTSDGLTFPVSQVASADANTLDDYEEGTFTPTVIGSSTAGTASYTVQVGSYTKIGQQVTVQLNVVYSGGTGTGNLNISGLPFTCANVANRFFVGSLVLESVTTTALNQAYCGVGANTASIDLAQFPLGGGSATNVSYDAAGQIIVTLTYFS